MKIGKKDLSILIGNSLDHYDVSLYGFLVPIIAPLFFPKYDYIVQLILAYSLYLTTLFSKPLGIVIFSLLTEKRGPTYALSFSLIGVGICSFIIGFLPGFDQIGVVSPLILAVVLMVRDIFSAGETSIAKFYIIEHKNLNESKSLSYLYQASSMLGIIIASAIVTLLIKIEQAVSYWRIAFWLGGLIAVFGAKIRSMAYQEEICPDEKFKSRVGWSDIKDLFLKMNKAKINIAKVAFATSFGYMTYSIPFVFLNNFVPLVTDISLKEMMEWNTYLLIFDFLALVILGLILKHYDHKKVMKYSAFLLAISAIGLFYFIPSNNLTYITFVRIYIVLIGVAFSCYLNIWEMELFPFKDKYFCVGVGSIIGGATLGKLTTSICLALWYLTANPIAPAFYIVFISLLAGVIVSKTNKSNLTQ